MTTESSNLYRIELQGKLNSKMPCKLKHMSVTVERSDEGSPVTIIEGYLKDNEDLAEVLNALYELRIPILSVVCMGKS
jgi:hypothetical protein